MIYRKEAISKAEVTLKTDEIFLEAYLQVRKVSSIFLPCIFGLEPHKAT